MGNVPLDLRYSNQHEWVREEGDKYYVGITDFAQKALGDVVFIELPDLDSEIGAGEVVGVIESVKAASDLYSPLSGTIVEVNEELVDSPDKVNLEPYESWIYGVELKDKSEFDDLMSAEEYKKYCDEEE